MNLVTDVGRPPQGDNPGEWSAYLLSCPHRYPALYELIEEHPHVLVSLLEDWLRQTDRLRRAADQAGMHLSQENITLISRAFWRGIAITADPYGTLPTTPSPNGPDEPF